MDVRNLVNLSLEYLGGHQMPLGDGPERQHLPTFQLVEIV